jgi:hypothetical protein
MDYYKRYKKYKKRYRKLKKLYTGGSIKQETITFINELPTESIKYIAEEYTGIDTKTYKFIEVPQGNVYEYDGNTVMELATGRNIATGTNIILYIMGMGPCRGIIIIETHKIIMGHLDEIYTTGNRTLTKDVLTKCLSGSKDNIQQIYYIMGNVPFESTLAESSTFNDITIDVVDIIRQKQLEGYICLIKDFAYYMFSTKLGYDFENGEIILFPIHPRVTDRFITQQSAQHEECRRCDYLLNRIIRKRKNLAKYNKAKKDCIECNYKVKSRGKSKFICTY